MSRALSPRALLWAGMTAFALGFSVLSVLQHAAFNTGRFDLGNMTQVVWSTANGDFLRMTSLEGEQISRLAAHVDPILALFAPLWLVWPSPDLLVTSQAVLVALGAQVRVVGPGGERLLPLAGFHTGYLETVLGRGELIAEVICPVQGARRATYLKCTTRAADDWPALGLAAVLSVDGDTIREACLVASAATDVPTRLAQAEAVLLGARPDDARLARAGEAAAAETTLIGDEHGSAAYKRELLQVCVGRAVRAALAGA